MLLDIICSILLGLILIYIFAILYEPHNLQIIDRSDHYK